MYVGLYWFSFDYQEMKHSKVCRNTKMVDMGFDLLMVLLHFLKHIAKRSAIYFEDYECLS